GSATRVIGTDRPGGRADAGVAPLAVPVRIDRAVGVGGFVDCAFGRAIGARATPGIAVTAGTGRRVVIVVIVFGLPAPASAADQTAGAAVATAADLTGATLGAVRHRARNANSGLTGAQRADARIAGRIAAGYAVLLVGPVSPVSVGVADLARIAGFA